MDEENLTAKSIIKELVPDIFSESPLKPSQFINKYWTKYKEKFSSNSNFNGSVFEELISIALIREKTLPLYLQAKVTHIPGVNYDCIIYTQDAGPISLSAKTSLRERWKQADLEALALKNIYRKSESYLISMEENEVRRRKNDSGSVMALNGFILANSDEFDELLWRIKKLKVIASPSEVSVTSNSVISEENYLTYYSQ